MRCDVIEIKHTLYSVMRLEKETCVNAMFIGKLLNFRKPHHSKDDSGNSEIKNKWNRNFHEKVSKIWVFLRRLPSISEIM